jgi:cytochrome c-type biogenesis protein CcmE
MTRLRGLAERNDARLWLRVAIVAVAIFIVEVGLVLVSLSSATSFFPYLASGPSGFDAGRQLAYGQLLAAVVAVALAGGLGLVAVEQLSWPPASLSSRDSSR